MNNKSILIAAARAASPSLAFAQDMQKEMRIGISPADQANMGYGEDAGTCRCRAPAVNDDVPFAPIKRVSWSQSRPAKSHRFRVMPFFAQLRLVLSMRHRIGEIDGEQRRGLMRGDNSRKRRKANGICRPFRVRTKALTFLQ